jgi:putative acetyltransferase
MQAHTLRVAKNADCPQIWSLISSILSEYRIATDLATTDKDLLDIEENYVNNGGAFFVLLEDENIIGTVALIRDSESTCELCRMYLAATHRRRGLGRVLLNKVLSEARQREFSEVRLETAAVLVQAIALYRSVGFEFIAGTPSGKNCNLLMSKKLG